MKGRSFRNYGEHILPAIGIIGMICWGFIGSQIGIHYFGGLNEDHLYVEKIGDVTCFTCKSRSCNEIAFCVYDDTITQIENVTVKEAKLINYSRRLK